MKYQILRSTRSSKWTTEVSATGETAYAVLEGLSINVRVNLDEVLTGGIASITALGDHVASNEFSTMPAISVAEDLFLFSNDPVLLIGQGIATDEIEDYELAELDTASSDSAFDELADSGLEDGEGSETVVGAGDVEANDDVNFDELDVGLELEVALSNDFLTLFAEPTT